MVDTLVVGRSSETKEPRLGCFPADNPVARSVPTGSAIVYD
jgi:hypothetical protein